MTPFYEEIIIINITEKYANSDDHSGQSARLSIGSGMSNGSGNVVTIIYMTLKTQRWVRSLVPPI